MKLVMFDIDGTLTQTNDVDDWCFVQALRDVFGFTGINTDWSIYPHCTDSGLLEVIFQTQCRRSPLPTEVADFQVQFVSLLTQSAAAQPFSQVSGAQDFLDNLMARSECAVSLASGGWRCSAYMKLTRSGLDLLHLPAAFADDAPSREAIMQTSLARAAEFRSRDSFSSIIYIGDGVWDARASRNLGYRFIGIAHEQKRVERLRAEGAQHVFADYRDENAIMALLQESQPNFES